MTQRFARQQFLGRTSDETFARCRVAVVGLGGGGSHIVQQLAHLGIGRFTLADGDRVENHNLNRLVGATAEDAWRGVPKVEVARRLIKGVNPDALVRTVGSRWQESAIALRDSDALFGCVDSYAERDEIEREARRYMIPYIDIGMDVTRASSGRGYVISGQVILSIPGRACMRCLGYLRDERLAAEASLYGSAGPRPQVVWPNGVLASTAVGAFTQLLAPWHEQPLPVYIEYDGNANTLLPSSRLSFVGSGRCPHFDGPSCTPDPLWQQRLAEDARQV